MLGKQNINNELQDSLFRYMLFLGMLLPVIFFGNNPHLLSTLQNRKPSKIRQKFDTMPIGNQMATLILFLCITSICFYMANIFFAYLDSLIKAGNKIAGIPSLILIVGVQMYTVYFLLKKRKVT